MTGSNRRLRTPTQDRALLAEPPFGTLVSRLDENRRVLETDRVRLGGHPLREIRRMARQEILGDASDAPLIVSGHQPELFHPGVWVKNFAARGLAQKLGGRSLNLIVDNDTVKSADLKLPTWDYWEADHVRMTAVPFARVRGEQPWETLTPADDLEFDSLPDRVRSLTTNWGYEPLLNQAWSRMTGRTVGERFTAARRSFERDWGCENIEVTVSQLSRSRAFQCFAHHLLHDHARFRKVYNASVQRYRETYSLRSRTHPVPDLAENESPFWVTGEDRRTKATPASSPDHLRPRALTLTLFARLCLGDLFLHGIGGGKYDEVTDQIIRDYFGLEPPAFQILSGTLLLPLPSFASRTEDVERQARVVRDFHWNPQRHLAGQSTEHLKLRESNPPDHAGRRQRYRDFRNLAEKARPRVAEGLSRAEARLQQIKAEVAANEILQRRDYSWALYPEETLRPFLQGVQRRAASR